MTEELSVTPAMDFDRPADKPAGKFFVVSTRKLAVLYLATLGLYSIYWFYKQWDAYKQSFPYDSEQGKMWPAARSIFPMFFVFALLRHIKEEAGEVPKVAQWSQLPMARMMTALLVLSSILDRAARRGVGSPMTDIISLLVLAPLCGCFISIQDKINAACHDPDGAGNANFTWANYVWIVIGAVFWVLVAIGLFMPDQP